MNLTSKCFISLLLPLGLLILGSGPAAGQSGPKPLLMEGKKTLFQRVIIHPGVTAYDGPAGQPGAPLRPFTVLYVYERARKPAGDWLKVSPAANGQNLFWVPQEGVSEWKQALTLIFSQRAGRDPLLFFKSLAELEKTAGQVNVLAALAKLETEFKKYARSQSPPPANFPVIGMEPPDEQGAVPYNRFYLMPIFSYAEPFEGAKFLEVASIDPGRAGPQTSNPPGPGPAESGGGFAGGPEISHIPPKTGELKSGLAFVIDTTISMGPYIEKSLDVTRGIYDAVTAKGQKDQIGLAVVAYRSSLEASPGLEYASKVISPLRLAQNREDFEKALSEVREAPISSHSFNEDAFAGIKTAVEKLDWSPYQSRIILLITDAGPLDNSDPYSSTKMNSREMADLARQHNIKIITLHVKTPGGKHNHAYAAKAYRELSPLAEGETGYLALEAADSRQGAEQFAQASRILADKVAQAVAGAPQRAVNKPKKPDAPAGNLTQQAEALGDLLGYSIQLEYLGRANNSAAPQVVRSWIADKDLARLAGPAPRSTATVEVAVLLSKDQLSALKKQLELIIDSAERSKKTDSRDFFNSIMSASAELSRDPARFAANPGRSLGELGLLGEFIEGLPYQSDILTMTEDDWYKMSVGQQTQFINRLKSRLARYDEYYQDVDNWEGFGSPYPGDHLYRVPLSMLP